MIIILLYKIITISSQLKVCQVYQNEKLNVSLVLINTIQLYSYYYDYIQQQNRFKLKIFIELEGWESGVRMLYQSTRL